jgi:hypothetical protein
LADHLRVNPIPELLRGEPPPGIGADDEIALMQSATTAQVVAIPFEKKTQRRFAGCLGLPGILDAAVDDNKCGVAKKRMDGYLIPAHPEHIREGQIFEAAQFAE